MNGGINFHVATVYFNYRIDAFDILNETITAFSRKQITNTNCYLEWALGNMILNKDAELLKVLIFLEFVSVRQLFFLHLKITGKIKLLSVHYRLSGNFL